MGNMFARRAGVEDDLAAGDDGQPPRHPADRRQVRRRARRARRARSRALAQRPQDQDAPPDRGRQLDQRGGLALRAGDDLLGRVRRRLHQGIRLFAPRRRGQEARRRTRAHRLQGRASRSAGGPIHAFFELHIEQGPILEDEELRRRHRHPRPGPALVRNPPDRLREPRRLDADAAPQGRAARRRAHRRARQRDRPLQGAARRLHRRHAQPLSQFAQRHPRRSVHDLRVPPSDRRDA